MEGRKTLYAKQNHLTTYLPVFAVLHISQTVYLKIHLIFTDLKVP